MAEIDLGNVMGPQGEDGSQWYWGTAITGTSTSGAVFSSSGITNARVNDKYYNTSTSNIYTCTTAGAASVARWAYIGNIKGEQGNIGPAGPTGSVDFTTPITFSIAGTRSDLASGDSIATLFGKTQKWFADINSGGASTLLATNLSANRALISNANGKVAVSSVTSTELGYLDGVTSAIQTQLNTINTSIGTLSDLTTTAKSSLVAAANELNGKIQSGTYTVPSGGNGEIIFDPPFSATPRLVLTSVGSATNIATAFKIKSINAAKAEILVMYVTNSGVEVANSQSDLHWIACES